MLTFVEKNMYLFGGIVVIAKMIEQVLYGGALRTATGALPQVEVVFIFVVG